MVALLKQSKADEEAMKVAAEEKRARDDARDACQTEVAELLKEQVQIQKKAAEASAESTDKFSAVLATLATSSEKQGAMLEKQGKALEAQGQALSQQTTAMSAVMAAFMRQFAPAP